MKRAKPPGLLTSGEVAALALFNAERARGLLHTSEWQTRMAGLQARFEQSRADPTGSAYQGGR